MRWIVAGLLAAVSIGMLSAGETAVRYETLALDGERVLPFAVQLPDAFDPAKAYPVLVGPGDGTADGERARYRDRTAAQQGWITVESPFYRETAVNGVVYRLLDRIAKQYKVEGGKFHMVGWSRNGPSAMSAVLGKPERFHSITLMPGYLRWNDARLLGGLRGVKVRLIVGEQDTAWLDGSRKTHAGMLEAGVDATLEVVPGAGHTLDALTGELLIRRMQTLR